MKKEKKKEKKESSLYPNGFKHVQTADNCQRKKEIKEKKKCTTAISNYSLKSFRTGHLRDNVIFLSSDTLFPG